MDDNAAEMLPDWLCERLAVAPAGEAIEMLRDYNAFMAWRKRKMAVITEDNLKRNPYLEPPPQNVADQPMAPELAWCRVPYGSASMNPSGASLRGSRAADLEMNMPDAIEGVACRSTTPSTASTSGSTICPRRSPGSRTKLDPILGLEYPDIVT
jgi:hypothetical protein